MNKKPVIRDSVRIFYYQGQHLAVVWGKKPRHSEVVLNESTNPAGLPVLGVLLKPAPNDEHSQKVQYSDNFYMIMPVLLGTARKDRLIVKHRDRSEIVPVELFLRENPLLSLPDHRASVATGYSQNFCLDEAFHDALKQLPPLRHKKSPKALTIVDVVAMGAIYAGFSGFSRLFVRVEQSFHFDHMAKQDTPRKRIS